MLVERWETVAKNVTFFFFNILIGQEFIPRANLKMILRDACYDNIALNRTYRPTSDVKQHRQKSVFGWIISGGQYVIKL